MITVVIDPGHGGTTARGGSSPLGGGEREKDRTLQLARSIAANLGPSVRTRLTRDRDVNPTLAERASLARAAGASVFLSLHTGGRGEAWVHPRAGGSSRDLAWMLQRELSLDSGRGGGGVKAADLALLRPEAVGMTAAACLLELEDEGSSGDLHGGPGVDGLGRAIARAIHRYLIAARELLRLMTERADEMDSDDGEPYPALGNPSRRRRRYGGWATDDVSPDYRHLSGITGGMSMEFTLSAAVLQTLCDWNAFEPASPGGTAVTLFGLRGCMLTDDGYDGGFADGVRISEDLPDHEQNHCVLGVWARSGENAGKVAAFRGSTVPNLAAMRRYADGGEACNMLLTGRYGYHVGPHRPAGHRLHLEGVFVEDAPPITVIRSRDDTTYTTSDFFDLLNPGDNIHPSRDTLGETFSSEGCQTVRGGGDTAGGQFEHTRGPGWVKFRERAGLTPLTAPASENGRRNTYLLLTGREARLAAWGAEAAGMRRLRQGSSGPAVRALQSLLAAEPADRRYAGPLDGTMNGATVMAYVRRQQALDGGVADGIVTPAAAAAMGFDIETGAPMSPALSARRA